MAMPQVVASGADDSDKKKMSRAKAANTREVTMGKREATPRSPQAPEKRYTPKGTPTTPEKAGDDVNPYSGRVYRTKMQGRSETSQPGSALGKGYQIKDAKEALDSRERMGRMPAGQKQIGARKVGYKPSPRIDEGIAYYPVKENKPYRRETYGEQNDPMRKRLTTAQGRDVREQAGKVGYNQRITERKISLMGGRPTEPLQRRLNAERERSIEGRRRADEIDSRNNTARLAAQAKYGRDAMQKVRDTAAAQVKANDAARAQRPARVKSAVNNAVGAVRQAGRNVAGAVGSAAKSPVGRFGAGFVTGVGAMAIRRQRDVGDAEFKGFQAGKAAGRQTTSTGAKAPLGPRTNKQLGKAPSGPRVEQKRSNNGSYVSPIRKKLMGK